MKPARLLLLVFASFLLARTAWSQAPAKRAITFDDLISMHRLSDPQPSPDGTWVAYVVATPDKEANRLVKNIWLVPTAGGEPRQFTQGGSDTRPRWSPDGKRLAFLSVRDETSQVYVMSITGGEGIAVTHLSTGADNELWSPDGRWMAFTSSVYRDCKDDACNRERNEAREKSKVKARTYDRLLYRHWDAWWDGTRSHLFVIAVDAKDALPRDLTPGADYDVPMFFLQGPEEIDFSPDSKEICFAANTDRNAATSTNGDLFVVPVSGAGPPERITKNPGNDQAPVYSPNGLWIAYRAQFTAGYESDHWRLMLYDRATGQHINVTESFDRNPEFPVWGADSKTIYFPAEDRGEMPVFVVGLKPSSAPKVVLANSYNPELVMSRDGRTLIFGRSSMTMPEEIFAANPDGSGVHQFTHQNAALLAQLDLPAPQSISYQTGDGSVVQAFLLHPPHFDASKKYPLLLLVHGGPEGAWNDAWGYRWNAQLFASPGYVALMPNPRASTGFGQKFTQQIQADWGGKVFVDIMNGVDYALATYPFIDRARMAAAGGSYGGYMMDWFESHSEGRFRCLISHAGVYNLESEYGATEELWFPEWEFRGTPWNDPEHNYETWSPHKYAAEFSKYKTPMLIFTGERDYRVPYTESLQLFTALQRQGVPSKLVVFPDEGHWILKPQNSELWYKTFLGWLSQYLK